MTNNLIDIYKLLEAREVHGEIEPDQLIEILAIEGIVLTKEEFEEIVNNYVGG